MAETIRTYFLDYDLILFGRLAYDGDAVNVSTQVSCHLGIPRVVYSQEIYTKDQVLYARKYISSSKKAGAYSIHPRTGCHQAAQNCRYYQNLSGYDHSASGWKCHRCWIVLSQNRFAFNPKNRTAKGQIHLNDAFKRTQ